MTPSEISSMIPLRFPLTIHPVITAGIHSEFPTGTNDGITQAFSARIYSIITLETPLGITGGSFAGIGWENQ